MKMQKYVIFVGTNMKISMLKIKTYRKDRGRCHYTGEYRGAAYTLPKMIPVDLHKGSYYDHHFIIKTLAEEFEKQFTCLQENTEK